MLTDPDDYDLVIFLSALGPCSLNRSPGKNWVEASGGLPTYICNIARAINTSGGHSVSQSIAIAVSRVKAWAAGGTVNGHEVSAAVKAKSAAAVAAWEALRAKNKTRQLVKASSEQGDYVIMLAAPPTAVTEFNVNSVSSAWEQQQRELRQAALKKNGKNAGSAMAVEAVPYSYIKELWTTYLIVSVDDPKGTKLFKVPYTVDSTGTATFGEGQPVTVTYSVDPGADLTDEEKSLLGLDGSEKFSLSNEESLDKIIRLARANH